MQEFMNENTMYVILFVVFIIWLGIATYLFRLDKNLKRIERTIKTDMEINEN